MLSRVGKLEDDTEICFFTERLEKHALYERIAVVQIHLKRIKGVEKSPEFTIGLYVAIIGFGCKSKDTPRKRDSTGRLLQKDALEPVDDLGPDGFGALRQADEIARCLLGSLEHRLPQL